MIEAIGGAPVAVGAQDLFWADRGAYTGAVSGADLRRLGCRYVEVGHAERRQVFGEDAGTTRRKFTAALRNFMRADPDLIIVQGSINDRRLPAAGYRAAVDAAWDALSKTYPRAQIVILGPAPQVLPVESATARIDRDLAAAAAERGWWYISPLQEEWITSDDYLDIIDTGAGNNPPSTAGHRYLAERLAEAVAALTR